MAIQASGIKAIIAKSFTRIFYRNCINQGFMAIIANTNNINKDDLLKIDLKNKLVINLTKNRKIAAAIPDVMIKLYHEGGMIAFIKKCGLTAIFKLFKN
jgi:3-isopropylmalate dehydratase small subunit